MINIQSNKKKSKQQKYTLYYQDKKLCKFKQMYGQVKLINSNTK